MSKGEQIVPFRPQALKLCWAVGASPYLPSRESHLCIILWDHMVRLDQQAV